MKKPPPKRRREPMTPDARIRRAAEVMIATYRHQGIDDWPDRVIRAAKDALSADSRKWASRTAGSLNLRGIAASEPMLPPGGIFRMVLVNEGLDVHDEYLREHFMSIVQAVVAENRAS